MVKLAVEALEEKKGEDVKIIDIEGVSVIADYFVLASASNVNQTQALVDNVEEKLFKAGYGQVSVLTVGYAQYFCKALSD